MNQLFHKYLFFYLIFVLFSGQEGFAQTSKADSLMARLPNTEGEERVELLVKIANAFYPDQLENANKYGREALSIAEKIDFAKGRAESYFIMAKITRRFNQPDSALQLYFTAIEYFNETDYEGRIAGVFNNVGIIYKNKGKYRLAYDYYSRALKIFEKKGDKVGMGQVLSNIGIVFRRQGNYEEAIKYFIRSLEVQEEINEHLGIAITNGNLGNLYKNQDNFNKALSYYTKALDKFEDLGKTNNSAIVLNNIGILYEDNKQYDKALNFYNRALNIFEELDLDDNMGVTLSNVGSIYNHQEQYGEALKSHQQALDIFLKIGSKAYVAEAYNDIGAILTKIKSYNEALNSLQTGLTTAIEIGDKDAQIESLNNLYQYYETVGDSKSSFAFYKQYNTLKDSLYNINKTQQIAEIQTKYETQKKEQENELLRKDQVVKNEIISRQRFENTVLFFGTGLVLIFAIYFYRNNQQRKHTNQLLSQQNTEINQKQEVIIKINESLKKSELQLNEANEALQKLNEGLETKIKERTNELQKSNQELDTFLYQSSHALRRPIVNVMGLMQLARMEKQEAGLHQLFEKIEHTATNMDLMLKKLVMASEINFINTNQHMISFKDVIDKINNELSSIPKDNGLDIHWDIDPEVYLKAHGRLIEIILQNLVENAIIYHSDPKTRKPEIKVKIESLNPKVKISVYDNGQGIAKDSQSNIFNMFSVASDKTSGYGLGLYLVKKAVDKLKGTIKVESQENKFTCFEIILPQ